MLSTACHQSERAAVPVGWHCTHAVRLLGLKLGHGLVPISNLCT